MKNRIMKKLLAGVLVLCCATPTSIPFVKAAETELEDYVIYPTPQEMTYGEGSYILRENINVIYDEEIDSATKDRLEETAELKNLTVHESETAVSGMTNVYVGVYGSDGTAGNYISEKYNPDAALFEKNDAYFLASDNNVISVLGKDTDASFYGLTTLYHVFAQMDSLTIRNFKVKDYADVVSRGFIEGYYGNPWTTENRMDLMEWGGYYKLNSYFYAPKDDPKHNGKWRELYTEEEIETKIKPLAEAGNKSKCRFVFALHPYMNSPIRYNSEENYQADLKVMQDKFTQVIQAGVRQIAILADDANNVGADNYIRTLEDMSDWLKEMKKTYPDLKLTLPFCTQEYMYNGQTYYQRFPENVQIVMTGGKIWGEVTNTFTEAFSANAGRGPYMWINWPCTDNSKKHLIMGGYDTFLHPGVDPSKIQGIVLNPMQQSEPSKVAIFGNASYSWNIWGTKEEADQAWDASFAFVDHNSAVPNAASDALKELSKHMINQNMDSRVTPLQESVVLKELLTPFKDKLEAGTVTAEDVDVIIAEFEKLQKATKTYRQFAGDTKVRDQIVYWLDCWDDTTEAAIAYLNGVKSVINGDVTSVVDYNVAGKTAFDRSKTHGFHYVDHQEYAEAGVQHIVPFINAVANYVSVNAETALNPDKVIRTYITSRTDNPTGSVDNIFDGNDTTGAIYKTPNEIAKDDYVGVKYNRNIAINDIRFVLGAGKDHMDHAKLQYTTDGKVWQDIVLVSMDNQFAGESGKVQDITVAKENLPENFEAMGIRLIATENNAQDAWFEVREIQINKTEPEEEPEEAERYTGTVTYSGISRQGGSEANLFDGNPATEAMLAKGPYENPNRDKIAVDAYIQITFDAAKTVGSLNFRQGESAAGDVFTSAEVQYQTEGLSTWTTAGTLNSAKDQTVAFGTVKNVKAIRIVNKQETAGWVRVGEIDIRAPKSDSTPITYTVMKSPLWSVAQGSETNLYDGNDNTFVWYDPDGSGNINNDDFMVNDFLGYDLGKVATLASAHIVVGAGDGDKIVNYAIETSVDNLVWTAVEGYENYTGVTSGKDVLNIPLNGTEARYIRIRNLTQQGSWGKFSEFTVEEQSAEAGSTENVFTNIGNANVYSVAEEGSVSLEPFKTTLKPGEYAGFDLKNIRDIQNITCDVTADASVKLQTSTNNVIWTDVTGDAFEDARYVRLYNTSDTDQSVVVNELKAEYSYIGKKAVTSTFAGQTNADDMRTKGNVADVFDGDLTTRGIIAGAQEAGKKVVFDLGQERAIHSLRYYVNETSYDYPRYVKFEVANDPEAADADWTEVLVVGNDQFENTLNTSVAKDASYLTHDSQNPGNMYAERTGLDVSGRYLRVVPLKTYSHRWLHFNEIQINGGEYVTEEANKDVIADVIEEEGKIPSNMLDGDYRTTYKPSAQNGAFTYRISEAGQRTIRLIQNGQPSKAVVTAHIYKDNAIEEVTFGRLDQSINEFALPEDAQLLDVTVSWAEIVPEISIVKTTSAAQKTVNKEALLAELAKKDDAVTATWTKASQDAYKKAYDMAEALRDNLYVTQEVVNAAVGTLKSMRENAVVKGDASALEEALANKKVGIEDGVEIYSARAYAVYEMVMVKIREAIADKDNISQTEVDTLTEELADAEAKLTYSLIQRELGESTLEIDQDKYAEGDYTTNSYRAYETAKNTLSAAVEADKTTRKNPKEIAALREAYKTAKAGLVDVRELKALIGKDLEETLYTTDSWNAYKTALDQAKTVLTAGTTQEVAAAKSALEEAEAALEFKTPEINIQDVIDEMKKLAKEDYTEDSYSALASAIAKAEKDAVQGDETLNKANVKAMEDAKKALVNVVGLNAALGDAAKYEESAYTKDSYTVLAEAVKAADAVKKSGTAEEVAAAKKAIEDAISGLVVNAAGLEEYRNGIAFDTESRDYTAESYKAYKDAYDALMALKAGNTSVADFHAAKSAFEAAEEGLVNQFADYSKVTEAVSKVPSDLSIYTDASVKALKDVMNGVEYGLLASKQEQVDQYAQAIGSAIKDLKKKGDDHEVPSDNEGNTSGTQDQNNNDGVKTGDTSPIMGFVFLMLLSFAFAVLFKRKRRA